MLIPSLRIASDYQVLCLYLGIKRTKQAMSVVTPYALSRMHESFPPNQCQTCDYRRIQWADLLSCRLMTDREHCHQAIV